MASKFLGRDDTTKSLDSRFKSLEQQWRYGVHPFFKLAGVPVVFSEEKFFPSDEKALAIDTLGTFRCEQAYRVDSDGKETHLWVHVVNHAPKTELRRNGGNDLRYTIIRPFSPYYGKKTDNLFLAGGRSNVWTTHLVTDFKTGKIRFAEQHPSSVNVERRYLVPRVWYAMEGEPPFDLLLAAEQARRSTMPRTVQLIGEGEEDELRWATGLSVVDEAVHLLNSVPSPVTGRALAQQRLSGVYRRGNRKGFQLSTAPGRVPWASSTATVRSLEHLTNQLQVFRSWNGTSPLTRHAVYKIVQGLEAERQERIFGRPVVA